MRRESALARRLLAGTASCVVLLLLASVDAAQAQTTDAGSNGAVNAGEVSATGTAGTVPGVTAQPTQKQVFKSAQSVRVLNRQQMDAAGPVAGGAQILSLAPGANVTGYGNSGATKYTIMINGLNQGWGGYGGYQSNGMLGITFDGVPIVDPVTGLWASATIPQSAMLQNTTITYGPGAPVDKWYTNIGGSVEFTPLQPTAKPGGDLEMTYGSYNQKNIFFDLRTGTYHGWSSILSFGAGNGDSFRKGADGFTSPSHDYAAYLKTVKTFRSGNISLGAYYANSGGYRAQVIPVSPNPYITTNGIAGGPLYSQSTSGFYSTLPHNSYEKYDVNAMLLVYGKENINLDDTTTLHNLTWYMHVDRLHSRQYDVYLSPPIGEWNDPHTNAFGDKLWLTEKLPYNTIDVGAYFIHGLYNTRQNFYDTANADHTLVVPGGKFRDGFFSQDQVAGFIQDDIHPIPILHITPGITIVHYDESYTNSALSYFSFAPTTVVKTHCALNATSTPGNAKDQGSSCGSEQTRTGLEPSIDVSLTPTPWLNVYGGYQEAVKAPEVGGGGGLFQSVDPRSFTLAQGQYYQIGFKVHFQHLGTVLHNFLFGAAYYHTRFAKQEIDTTLGNGDTISANGTSEYHGVNLFVDDDPIQNLHMFANANVETATYTSFVTGGISYNGSKVPYVPTATVNVGAAYDIIRNGVVIQPRAWYQYTGAQYMFDNTVGAPSNRTMPSYGTLNLGVKATIPVNLGGRFGTRYMDVSLTALNILNKQYNQYEYISSGGYYNTPNNGYLLAYPGAPFTIYGSVGVHF